mgnify:CR=1 FL=1
MNMQEATRKMKADSYKMAGLSLEVRNNILANLRKDLSLMNISFLMLQKELMNLLSFLTL